MKIVQISTGGSAANVWRAHWAAILALALILPPWSVQAGENIIEASATDQSRVAAVSVTIMTRAYAALGYQLDVSYMPGQEALEESSSGQTDAELVRIEAVGRRYPTLVRVPEALFNIRGRAFAWNDTMVFRSEQDLWNRRIGIVDGIQWAAKIAKGHAPTIAENVHHLFELLADRHIDIALEAQLTGQPELKHFPNRGLVMLLESPIRIPVFHFLNKKHQKLAAPLANEIRKMKKNGAIKEIFQNYYRNANSGHD